MFFRRIQAVCGAVIAAAILVAEPPAARSAERDAVTVYRGASATTQHFHAGGPLLVQRGAPVKTRAYAAKADDGSQTRHVLAGERLWVVDSQAGSLTTCALRKSIQVGFRDIRCYTRALPASLYPTAD